MLLSGIADMIYYQYGMDRLGTRLKTNREIEESFIKGVCRKILEGKRNHRDGETPRG